mmetsp:Transcript_4943/g.9266  ORF Transcript_4943/g.9266 Transcript_4943/m.9266 type:complete len:1030 (+) Transcript_4943:37-3126(+)
MEPAFATKRTFFDFQPEISTAEVLNFSAKGHKPVEGQTKWEERNLIYKFVVTAKLEARVFDWHILRTYNEIKDLDSALKGRIPEKLPQFPKTKHLKEMDPNDRLKSLGLYLQGLTSMPRVNDDGIFWEFLEVSQLSFEGITKKRKEGYVYKRTGGRMANESKFCNCGKYFRRYQKRWLIVRDNLVGYMTDNTTEKLNEVFMFKGKFIVDYGTEATGWDDGIKLATSTRAFIFRTGSMAKRMEWVDAITKAYEESEWNVAKNENSSSFPVREDNSVTWYVDGEKYYEELYEALLKAKKQVLISDWWLSPELYLKRPASKYPESMLKSVLKSVAQRDVSVNVHVYKEVEFALTMNSLYTKNVLEAEHPNIKVVRHPHRSIRGGEFLWSHHEKLVVIDNEYAFMGGLDLCYGRMDTNRHLLIDNTTPYYWNGIDYSNSRVADFTEVQNWQRDSIDRNAVPRMPWHDIAMSVKGKVASDIALHFIELWNHVMTDITGTYYKQKGNLEPIVRRNTEEIKNSFSRIEKKSHELETDGILEGAQRSLLEETKEPVVLRKSPSEFDRPVSHSAGSFTDKKKKIEISLSEQDNERQIIEDHALPIEQSNLNPHVKRLLTAQGVSAAIINSPLIMRSATRTAVEEPFAVKQHLRPQPRAEIMMGIKNIMEKNKMLEINEEAKEKARLTEAIERGEEAFACNFISPVLKKQRTTATLGTCKCQLLRSAGAWSFGLDEQEKSIHKAYIDRIAKAERFIYIENQFFISDTAEEPVKNKITSALVKRIKAAYDSGEPFKVIVVMPLLPAFEGSVDDTNAAVLRVQLYWEYRTISGLYALLSDIPDPKEYISFYGLRTHAMLSGVPVTEMVYVHSKLMIVDDNFVIMGSANINDRSMLGLRDSEIALLIEDTEKVKVPFKGVLVDCSKFAHTLRIAIFTEHSGCNDPSAILDPFSPNFETAWTGVAKSNTILYRYVFRCYPDDLIERINEVSEYQRQCRLDEYASLRDNVKGFLVEFPLEFLKKEDLRISITNKEYFVPEISFI